MEVDVQGTRIAFLKMLQERGVHKKLGVDHVTVAAWKKRLEKDGNGVSIDKMEEMLLKGGGVVVQEKVWRIQIDKRTEAQEKIFAAVAGSKLTFDIDYDLTLRWLEIQVLKHANNHSLNATRDLSNDRSKVTFEFYES